MSKQPRPYQEAALKSLWAWLMHSTNLGNPLVVAPVAAGKSLLIGWFIKQVHEMYPRTRILVLTHVKELLVQNADELQGVYPECDYGFYCAGLGQKRLHNDVTFASIQSIAGKLANINRAPEIIIVDECHLISHKGTTQYRTFFDEVKQVNPNVKIIGFTGTPFRADTGRLEDGEGKLFDGIAYEIGMDYMIEEGFWAKPTTTPVDYKQNVSGVAMRGGDYVEKQLQEAVNTSEANDACAKELIAKGHGRKKWLIFTAGVEHAENVTAELVNNGISARFVHSKQDSKINDQNLADHKKGEFTALVNVAKLTTGYNDPEIDLLCFMRPTRSPVLYIQCIGRGVRVVYADGYDLATKQGRLDAIANSKKPDCLVVDFGGVIDELGAIDQVSIKKKYMPKEEGEGETRDAPVKICPSCAAMAASAQRFCYECGYQFFELSNKASESAVMSMDEPPEWREVIDWKFSTHHKGGDDKQPASLRVEYSTMQGRANEFICFEHHVFAGTNKYFAYEKARAWFKKHANPAYAIDNYTPESVFEAMEVSYNMPTHILVKRNGKYYNIIDTKYERQIEQAKKEDDFIIPF